MEKRKNVFCAILLCGCALLSWNACAQTEEELNSSFLRAGSITISTANQPSYAEILARGERYEKLAAYEVPRAERKDYFAYKLYTLSDYIDLKGWNATNSQIDEWMGYANSLTGWWPSLFKINKEAVDSGWSIVQARPLYMTDRRAELKAEEGRLFALVEGVESDVAKALVVHDFVCKEVRYYLDAPRNIFAVALDKIAQCDSYAKVYAYYMNLVGIPCEWIAGNTPEGYHAWNRVYLNGQWYLVDVTWDDFKTSARRHIEVSHNYFLKSGAAFARHSVTGADLARCSDTQYDNAFWTQMQSICAAYKDYVVYPDRDYNDQNILRCLRLGTDDISKQGKSIPSVNLRDWPKKGVNKYAEGNYCTPVFYKGRMYYNAPGVIWACDIDGKNQTKIVDLNIYGTSKPIPGQPNIGKDEYIFNLEFRKGTLFITTAPDCDDYMASEKCKVYAHVIDADNPYVKSPRAISTNFESLLIAVGETTYLDARPTWDVKIVSADASICAVGENGAIIGKSVGATRLILTTEESVYFAANRKEIPVEVTSSSVIDLAQAIIVVNNPDFRWPLMATGAPVEPTFTVGYHKVTSKHELGAYDTYQDTMEADYIKVDPKNYTVKYENNIAPGTARIIVTATGAGYRGSCSTTFPIIARPAVFDLSEAKLVLHETRYLYTGGPVNPIFSLTRDGTDDTYIPSNEYVVSYENNVEPGVARVMITGTGELYTGSISATFRIVRSLTEGIGLSISIR